MGPSFLPARRFLLRLHELQNQNERKVMNDKLDELAKGLAQSVTRTSLWLGVAVTLVSALHASEFRLGPISDLSDPDVFAGCGSNGSEKECSIAVNPTNPKNVVAAWIAGRFRGIGAAVSFDG